MGRGAARGEFVFDGATRFERVTAEVDKLDARGPAIGGDAFIRDQIKPRSARTVQRLLVIMASLRNNSPERHAIPAVPVRRNAYVKQRDLHPASLRSQSQEPIPHRLDVS